MRRIYKSIIFFTVLSAFVFGQRSSTASIVVLNGLTHENTALVGETYRAQIEIQNVAEVEKTVRIYQKDYWYNHKGESQHADVGTLKRSNGKWISLQSDLINLAPQEKTFINVEINVPKKDSIGGTYWSVIMVEGVVPPDTSKNAGVSITTALRYAIQMITNIGDTGSRDLNFAGLQLSKDGENSIVQVILENIGERLLKPEMSIELFDKEGNSVGIIKADRRKTLPGTSILVNIKLEGIKPGVYTGVLVADCGGDDIFGTNVSFELS